MLLRLRFLTKKAFYYHKSNPIMLLRFYSPFTQILIKYYVALR